MIFTGSCLPFYYSHPTKKADIMDGFAGRKRVAWWVPPTSRFYIRHCIASYEIAQNSFQRVSLPTRHEQAAIPDVVRAIFVNSRVAAGASATQTIPQILSREGKVRQCEHTGGQCWISRCQCHSLSKCWSQCLHSVGRPLKGGACLIVI